MDDIYNKITNLNNLFLAWKDFSKGKRTKPGVELFERYLEDNIFCLRDELVSGVYQHGGYYKFHIHDPKHRIIHKASVRDRLVHHAIHRILYPMFDSGFVYDSYSCRIGKGTHAAVNRLNKFARKSSKNYSRICWSLKIDIKKFFDSIDHEILLQILKQKITSQKTIFGFV